MQRILDYRAKSAKNYFRGKGVEFGALHNPLIVDRTKAQIFYADKYSKADLLNNFPELQLLAKSIVETDIFLDLNEDNLQSLQEYNFDFFIANHVIEHLINPLQFLENVSQVMRLGSYLYLAVPDKDYTFDRLRELTTWEHLYDEYTNQIDELSEAHLADFIVNITKDHITDLTRRKNLYDAYYDPRQRTAVLEKHRQRSIHVHVWNQRSFDLFLKKAIAELKLNLKVVYKIKSRSSKHEMIYVLQKKYGKNNL